MSQMVRTQVCIAPTSTGYIQGPQRAMTVFSTSAHVAPIREGGASPPPQTRRCTSPSPVPTQTPRQLLDLHRPLAELAATNSSEFSPRDSVWKRYFCRHEGQRGHQAGSAEHPPVTSRSYQPEAMELHACSSQSSTWGGATARTEHSLADSWQAMPYSSSLRGDTGPLCSPAAAGTALAAGTSACGTSCGASCGASCNVAFGSTCGGGSCSVTGSYGGTAGGASAGIVGGSAAAGTYGCERSCGASASLPHGAAGSIGSVAREASPDLSPKSTGGFPVGASLSGDTTATASISVATAAPPAGAPPPSATVAPAGSHTAMGMCSGGAHERSARRAGALGGTDSAGHGSLGSAVGTAVESTASLHSNRQPAYSAGAATDVSQVPEVLAVAAPLAAPSPPATPSSTLTGSHPPPATANGHMNAGQLAGLRAVATCAAAITEIELEELGRLGRPHSATREVVETTLMLLGYRDAKWAAAQVYFERPKSFLERMRAFDASKSISRLQYQKLCRSLGGQQGAFDEGYAESICPAVGGLIRWCKAVGDLLSWRYGENSDIHRGSYSARSRGEQNRSATAPTYEPRSPRGAYSTASEEVDSGYAAGGAAQSQLDGLGASLGTSHAAPSSSPRRGGDRSQPLPPHPRPQAVAQRRRGRLRQQLQPKELPRPCQVLRRSLRLSVWISGTPRIPAGSS